MWKYQAKIVKSSTCPYTFSTVHFIYYLTTQFLKNIMQNSISLNGNLAKIELFWSIVINFELLQGHTYFTLGWEIVLVDVFFKHFTAVSGNDMLLLKVVMLPLVKVIFRHRFWVWLIVLFGDESRLKMCVWKWMQDRWKWTAGLNQ